MAESKSHGAERYSNLPLPLSSTPKPDEQALPSSAGESPSVNPLIRPRTPEEIAEDLFDDQGIISKALPKGRVPAREVRGVAPQVSTQVEANIAAGLPASFTPESHPDPRNRRGERTPWWRGSTKRKNTR